MMDRNRPITILGNPRISDTSALSSQVLNADGRGLHASSGFPLPTTSVDFPSWQNSGGGTSAAAAASPFYNLPRFPGYYQFPQINPAYLPTLWSQAPWQSSATAQQIQQHQLHQQQKQNHPLMQSNSVETSWIGASMSSDLNPPQSAAAVSSFHPPTTATARQISQTQPLSCSVNVAAAQNASSVSGFPSNFTSGMMPTSANLLSSFQTMYQQQQQQQRQQQRQQQPTTSVSATATAAAGITVNSANPPAIPSNFSLASTPNTMQSQFPVQFSSTAASVPTASSVANVKRMECDSSVPSPPKTQHQPQQNTSLSFAQCLTPNSNIAGDNRSSVTNNFTSVTENVKTDNSIVSGEAKDGLLRAEPSRNVQDIKEETGTTTAVPSTSTVLTELPQISQEAKSKREESDEDECSLSQNGTNLPDECVAANTNLQQEETWKEHSRSRSPSHHSPKRRGHGHSESSRSMSPVLPRPASEVSVKKYKKSNEVARLLNDLTEGAWMNLAGRSNSRHTVGMHDRNKSTTAVQSSENDSSEESDEESGKKLKRRSSTQNKGNSYRNSEDKPRRGRPKGSSKKRNSKKTLPRRRKCKRSSDSGNEETGSEDDSLSRSLPKKVGRPSTANREDGRSLSSRRGRKSGSTARATSASPKKRGRPPVKTQELSESESESDDSSNSSESSTASSFTPRHSKATAPKQRKVGTAPTSSAGRSGYNGRGRGLGRRGTQKRAGRPPAPDRRLKVKRKKKNSSSSLDSASDESTSDYDDAPSRRSFDRSAFHNPEEQCGAKSRCKMPQGNNVNWIQCDSCDVWFHRDCIGREVDENSEFHCGCKKTGKRRGRKCS